MPKTSMWPTGPVRTWGTEALEQFIADVDRGVVIGVYAGGRFLTLDDVHTELVRRRHSLATHHLASSA